MEWYKWKRSQPNMQPRSWLSLQRLACHKADYATTKIAINVGVSIVYWQSACWWTYKQKNEKQTACQISDKLLNPYVAQTILPDSLLIPMHTAVFWQISRALLYVAHFHLGVSYFDQEKGQSKTASCALQIEYQLLGADWYPDLIFSDEFNPMLPIPNLPAIGPQLLQWSMQDSGALTRLLQTTRTRYAFLCQFHLSVDTYIQFWAQLLVW